MPVGEHKYLSHLEAASLASSATAYWIQAGSFHLQLNGLFWQYVVADCQMTTTADNFDHPTTLRVTFYELAQVWAIDHTPLLDCICWKTYLSTWHLCDWSCTIAGLHLL